MKKTISLLAMRNEQQFALFSGAVFLSFTVLVTKIVGMHNANFKLFRLLLNVTMHVDQPEIA